MSNEIQTYDNTLIELENTQKMCQALMKTSHYAKMGPEGIYAIVAKAKSLGINPVEALNGGLYVVSGRVGMSSEMMASLIRQKGHSISKDPKSDNSVCILHGRRADNGDVWTCSFSIEDARRAGLMKNMYEKYPQIMIYNRCMSMLARQLFPDVIKGAGYTHEELKEIASSRAEFECKPALHTVEIIPEPQPEKPKQVLTDEQVEKLSSLLDQLPERKAAIAKFLIDNKMNSMHDFSLRVYENMMKTCMKDLEIPDSLSTVSEIET